MSSVVFEKPDERHIDLSRVSRELSENDQRRFDRIVSRDLTEEQRSRITTPAQVYPKQRTVLAVHWHPEFVETDLIRERIEAMFPNCADSLIIPTQHNVLTGYGEYTGVEVDCFSPGFNRKTQLLIHFSTSKIEDRGDVFRSMLEHTFKYRSSQLYEFIDSLLEPRLEDRVIEAAELTGVTADVVEFVRIHVGHLKQLIDINESVVAPEMLRNKLIRDYIDTFREEYDHKVINHVQVFVKTVKEIVKSNFALSYFYAAREVIAEARGLGAGIVIPHPEQFWPILLADLDVDGIEVWNPQSFEYTKFLISVVTRQNRTIRRGMRPILITMGDDCHMGEKVKDPMFQDKKKASREIGVQPPWDDLTIVKDLIVSNASRDTVIREYRSRLV